MLILYESSAGYALFKVKDTSKLTSLETISASAGELLSLLAFDKFESTAKAVDAATHLIEGKINDDLKSFLKKNIIKKGLEKETLAVADPKLAGYINKKLELNVVSDASSMELFRGIRENLPTLLGHVFGDSDLKAMTLGLSHSLSRHKIKFSPDKVDTMIVQAINLLDELDKELNIYCMRLKEWYGWHFPEMSKIITDNVIYAKIVHLVGLKTNISTSMELSDIIPEDLLVQLKAAAEISMGTEISEEDLANINHLAEQVISIAQYRVELFEYLSNRMRAIAPNLTVMVGELVGARLIAHAGSLMNLAKHPASTVQILGAEKALFRALKAKHDTPKYGLIYHASVVGQAAPKLKGKISRVLAAKTALAIRVDALSERTDDQDHGSIGLQNRQKVEERLKQLENVARSKLSGAEKMRPQQKKIVNIGHVALPTMRRDAKDFSLDVVNKYKQEQKLKEQQVKKPETQTTPIAEPKRKLEEVIESTQSNEVKKQKTSDSKKSEKSSPEKKKEKKHKDKKPKVESSSSDSD
jgi:nucleolar protein 58